MLLHHLQQFQLEWKKKWGGQGDTSDWTPTSSPTPAGTAAGSAATRPGKSAWTADSLPVHHNSPSRAEFNE